VAVALSGVGDREAPPLQHERDPLHLEAAEVDQQCRVARAAQAKPQDPVATTPKREPTRAERPLMLAAPPKGITLLSPFRDNTGA